jgi:hypothetical protein
MQMSKQLGVSHEITDQFLMITQYSLFCTYSWCVVSSGHRHAALCMALGCIHHSHKIE